jgi:hypothetical protein
LHHDTKGVARDWALGLITVGLLTTASDGESNADGEYGAHAVRHAALAVAKTGPRCATRLRMIHSATITLTTQPAPIITLRGNSPGLPSASMNHGLRQSHGAAMAGTMLRMMSAVGMSQSDLVERMVISEGVRARSGR